MTFHLQTEIDKIQPQINNLLDRIGKLNLFKGQTGNVNLRNELGIRQQIDGSSLEVAAANQQISTATFELNSLQELKNLLTIEQATSQANSIQSFNTGEFSLPSSISSSDNTLRNALILGGVILLLI